MGRGNRSPRPSLAAEMEDKVVGLMPGDASGWEHGVPEDIFWIDTIGLDTAYRKKGVAWLLMREMRSSMKKIGVDTVYTRINWRDWILL